MNQIERSPVVVFCQTMSALPSALKSPEPAIDHAVGTWGRDDVAPVPASPVHQPDRAITCARVLPEHPHRWAGGRSRKTTYWRSRKRAVRQDGSYSSARPPGSSHSLHRPLVHANSSALPLVRANSSALPLGLQLCSASWKESEEPWEANRRRREVRQQKRARRKRSAERERALGPPCGWEASIIGMFAGRARGKLVESD